MIDSRPSRLYLFRLSLVSVPVGDRTLEMALGCYLVELADGRHVLIDSGYPADLPPPSGAQPAEPATNVIEQLATLGLRADDVDLVICTHFDADHVGYHDAFTRAEHVVQRAHDELARSGHPRYAAARAHWDHPGLHYRLVEGDTEILPGLTLLETSGHCPGHQSILVRLPETGPVLLAIDAVMFERLFRADRPASPADDNAEQLQASTRKLLGLVERERVSLVVFGHDGEQWRALKTAPEFYG
jgi:N-acyl homoserine lactone hydrolase